MKLEDPKVDVMTLDYVPTIWDNFTRTVTLENGDVAEVDVWDTEGENFNTTLLLRFMKKWSFMCFQIAEINQRDQYILP